MRFPKQLIPALLFFALFAGFAYSARIPVAAVDLQENGLLAFIDLEAKARGSSQLFLNISSSNIDADTQASIKTAIHEAAREAAVDENAYDYTASILSDAENVNGPSAGAALAILAYSEFTGRQIRADFTITGTIEEGGAIGRVGGVREKIEAIGNSSSARVVAVPMGQAEGYEIGVFEDEGIGESAKAKWGIQVVEVANLSEALSIAFSPEGSQAAVPPRASLQALLVPFNFSQKTLGVRQLASSEVRELEQAFESPPANYSPAVKKSVQHSIEIIRILLDKGYFYSGANAAFLVKNQLDALAFKNLSLGQAAEKIRELQGQANETAFPEKTFSNWEWAAGGQLRYYWAIDKLAGAKETINQSIWPSANWTPDSSAVVGSIADGVSSAENWLVAAGRMNAIAGRQNAQSNQTKVDEEKFREYAEKLLARVQQDYNGSKLQDSEIRWHLQLAESNLENGAVLASAMESYFARSYLKAQLEVLSLDEADFESVEKLVSKTDESLAKEFKGNWNSLWAEAYYAHSEYSETEAGRLGDSYYLLNSLKLKNLANALEQNYNYVETGIWAIPQPLNQTIPAGAVEIPEEEEVPVQCIPTGGESGATKQPLNATQAANESISAEITITPNRESTRFVATIAFVLLALAGLAFIWVLSRKPQSVKERLHRLNSLLAAGHISRENYEHLKQQILSTEKENNSMEKEKTTMPEAKEPEKRAAIIAKIGSKNAPKTRRKRKTPAKA